MQSEKMNEPPEAEEKMIEVLVVRPGKTPETAMIGQSLESMQKVVDGLIESIMPFEDDVAIICNEEGKLLGMPLNRGLYDSNGNLQDIIAGTFFVALAPDDSEYFESLPPDKISKYFEMFKLPEMFMMFGGKIRGIKYEPEGEDIESEEFEDSVFYC
jgi:hypothetical protein